MPILELLGIQFVMNDDKYNLVYENRKLEFREVCSVFSDDYAITTADVGHYDENRFITVGMSEKGRLLTVVWTERSDSVRIITAFKPSHTQKRRYENA